MYFNHYIGHFIKSHRVHYSLIMSLLLFMLSSCIESFEGAVDSFEDVLVVNATITNENKKQEVLLSRSFRFEEDTTPTEENAQVMIQTDDGNQYIFEEVLPGKYLSTVAFAAEMNKEYTLMISTQDGKSYTSSSMQLPIQNTNIDNLYAERITNNDGVEGMGIFVDSFDPSGTSNYYRHEYIETFKIIAPFWTPFDIVVIAEGVSTITLDVIMREREERTCYGTNPSRTIIVGSTLALSEDRLSRYNVRFIEQGNYILTYRYSVLVRQYVQSPEAFSYYETLRGLSQSSGNVFSEDQPGFLAGNIFSIDNPSENIAGFFEVATVDEKRIFFDYEDFFPGEEPPPYIADCIPFSPSTEGGLGQRDLLNLIYADEVRFYDFPGVVVRKECGDCTTLGSNVAPEFWIE